MSSEEQPKKMHDGYHGWMKTIPKTDQDFTPVRIETSGETSSAAAAGSAWNAAGTWEERDKSEWARDSLKQQILDGFAFTNDQLRVAVKARSVVRCNGDAKVVFSRGKKRCGFDMTLKFEWTSSRTGGEDAEEFPEATGHVELHDFDDMTGEDYEIHVSCDGSSDHARDAKKAIESWEQGLRQLLAQWKEDLLQQ
ncbi:hypothetical protein P43SY_007459 [Pythium insidiosum]|uniref:Activator of Hsp90 ATPase AHSA1-like N-terminal domain-containing protein n=1 Tax=Pythium insidiosum TaxID=114742 RepID=A0AAD5Q480_PYTIN|nr:hypothetical protein P43SY_007459 [Pythium insidiosum]